MSRGEQQIQADTYSQQYFITHFMILPWGGKELECNFRTMVYKYITWSCLCVISWYCCIIFHLRGGSSFQEPQQQHGDGSKGYKEHVLLPIAVHSIVVLKSGSWAILVHEQELLSMGKHQTHHFVLSLYIRFPKCFKGTPGRTEVERG